MYNDKKLNILSTVVSDISYLVGNPAVFVMCSLEWFLRNLILEYS